MSQYVTRLREEHDEQGQVGRDRIEWPTPIGTWKQNEGINRLETFADNLDVSQSPADTDLLNSVPTPWARLLLFEAALYNTRHPSHRDIEDQWRGLLGVLALATPLRLNIATKAIQLTDFHQSRIGRSFLDLRPQYQMAEGDAEDGKWNQFQMVFADGALLGATSPRTLVYTGISHRCPSSIPFRSTLGRLSNPVAYYKKFNDFYYLGLLARWVSGLIDTLEHNQQLATWLGDIPAAPGAAPQSRMGKLLERLRAWQAELLGIQQADVAGEATPRFTLSPYNVVRGLPVAREAGISDLFLRGRNDVIVCYQPARGSQLLNAYGDEVVNEHIKIYDGRWIQADEPLPVPLTFVPNNIRVIEDPSILFEEALIQINLPETPSAVHYLQHGSRMYLFPFKSDVLNYFSPGELAENTKIFPDSQSNKLRVELKIPLANNRMVKVSREYPLDTGVIADPKTAELAAWPDFASPAWKRYFYVKAEAGKPQVDFEPVGEHTTRTKDKHTWYTTPQPAEAFVGAIDGKKGLLVLKNNSIAPPDKFWKLGVDFGSTHTRAFSLLVERRGDGYVTSPGIPIQPVSFATRAQALTFCDETDLKPRFFPLIGTLEPTVREELKSLLMMPETNPVATDDWLPREGYVYTHWIYDGDYDSNGLRSNLKWNSHRDDPDLRAFLRCLLVMIQAEAIKQGAQVVSIAHTYPSVFTEGLVAKHKAEWRDLEEYINSGSEEASQIKIEDATITETVAVCRHLEWEQGASPIANTISLDIGGSTTDMAVWAAKKLEVQESVKMAAGIIGSYLQSSDAKDFLRWLESTLRGAPYNLKNFSMSRFASKPSGYSLMFNNLLSATEWRNHLDVLVDQIKGAKEARRLLSHVIYLYGGLLYYAGLLARKAGLQARHDTYYLFFCGKGGTLIRWISAPEDFAQQMFEAGLFGPGGRGTHASPSVVLKTSQRPKEEVGRGLLAESHLQGNPKDKIIGLLDPNPPSVTVGETGYEGLSWDGELNPTRLLQLPDGVVPAMKDLQELNTFMEAFKTATQSAANELGLESVTARAFQTRLLQRLFGSSKGSIITDIRTNDEDALMEPLFITELKVLLETTTKNNELFA